MSNPYRVTHRTLGQRSLHGLQHNLSSLGRLQEQLSSGRAITRPSDSPTGTSSALRLRTETRTTEQYARNASDGLGWLTRADSALNGSVGTLQRVRDLVLQGLNAGSVSPEAMNALAAEVTSLRENLLSIANTTYLDRPIFGGTTAGSVAYTAAGGWAGDSNAVFRTVSDNASVRVDITGPEAFGAPGPTDAFAVLADIATNLTTNPGALSVNLTSVDGLIDNVINELADVGARTNRIEYMRQSGEDRVIGLRTSLAEVESIDLPKTIVELQMQQAAYSAALGATARVVQPSLVDFLR